MTKVQLNRSMPRYYSLKQVCAFVPLTLPSRKYVKLLSDYRSVSRRAALHSSVSPKRVFWHHNTLVRMPLSQSGNHGPLDAEWPQVAQNKVRFTVFMLKSSSISRQNTSSISAPWFVMPLDCAVRLLFLNREPDLSPQEKTRVDRFTSSLCSTPSED